MITLSTYPGISQASGITLESIGEADWIPWQYLINLLESLNIIFWTISALLSLNKGSTIELSCDGPIRKPYIAYMQGGLTYEYGKLAVLIAVNNMK